MRTKTRKPIALHLPPRRVLVAAAFLQSQLLTPRSLNWRSERLAGLHQVAYLATAARAAVQESDMESICIILLPKIQASGPDCTGDCGTGPGEPTQATVALAFAPVPSFNTHWFSTNQSDGSLCTATGGH